MGRPLDAGQRPLRVRRHRTRRLATVLVDKYMCTQVATTTLLVAAALLAGGCSKRSAHAVWSSSKSIVIEPGVASGSVQSGMTIQQVIAELGQPDRTVDSGFPEINRALEYTNYGIYFIPGEGEVVHIVSVGPPFAGRTKEGIGIGSGRADVIKAYGEPTTAKPIQPHFEGLRYESISLRFQLHDGTVALSGVVFKTTK